MWMNQTPEDAKNQFLFDVFSGRIILGWRTSASNFIGLYDIEWRNFDSTPNFNTWHYTVFLFDRDTVSLFLNGEQYGETLAYVHKPIGGSVTMGSGYNGKETFSGIIDEFRVSTSIHSPDWIYASWKNQGDNEHFNSYAEVVLQAPQGTIYVFW
jgi:hypothetical protein